MNLGALVSSLENLESRKAWGSNPVVPVQIGTLVAVLPGALGYRDSARTGWLAVGLLSLDKIV